MRRRSPPQRPPERLEPGAFWVAPGIVDLADAGTARGLYQKAYELSTGHNPPAAFSRPFTRKKLGLSCVAAPVDARAGNAFRPRETGATLWGARTISPPATSHPHAELRPFRASRCAHARGGPVGWAAERTAVGGPRSDRHRRQSLHRGYVAALGRGLCRAWRSHRGGRYDQRDAGHIRTRYPADQRPRTRGDSRHQRFARSSRRGIAGPQLLDE